MSYLGHTAEGISGLKERNKRARFSLHMYTSEHLL